LTFPAKTGSIIAEVRFMKPITNCFPRLAAAFCAAWGIGLAACGAWGTTLRIVSYNIDCADQGSDHNITGPQHSLPTVIQGIGLHHLGTNAHRMDILNVEELNSTTLSNFTVALTNIYGYGTYTYDPTVDTNTGGGPDGLIYNTQTIQVISGRCLRTLQTVLLQSNGTYISAHSPGGGVNGVTRGPMVYRIRPIGFGSNDDFYMYVSHARSSSDDAQGDARYAEAQEVRSDAKYNLPAGSHILYAGDWNLFNGSGENAYKCLTGQITSDGINWADNSSIWANTNQTQGYDPMSKTVPPTTTVWSNLTTDHALYLYGDATEGSYGMTSRIDMQLPNALMYAAYNSQGGVQLAPDTSDPYDVSNYPASQFPYAFETFGNNGSVPYGDAVTYAGNDSLADLANTTPNSTTLINDLVEITGANFTGSDHYPIFGDYNIVVLQPPVANFSATPTNGVLPLTVTFTDSSTGAVTNWFWNFGDGATGNITTTNILHTYTNAGVYSVTETVTGPNGTSFATQTNLITVLTPYQAWQLQYFGCTNCPQAQTNADADGTGQDNLFKYAAGLNPTNPASIFVFQIASVTNQPTEENLIFSPVVPGRIYTPLYNTNLLNQSWVPLTTGVTNTNGVQATITDTNATQPQKYYEIQINGP